jgi:hypothetical protein
MRVPQSSVTITIAIIITITVLILLLSLAYNFGQGFHLGISAFNICTNFFSLALAHVSLS